MKNFDYVVIGSGIAGLSFALKVAEKGSVAIITKKSKADSNTAWAQGGIACVTSSEDSIASHVNDTLIAGDGLCHEDVVRTILEEGPEHVAELVALGMHFDERADNQGKHEPDLGREGGHSKRRILHARDVTGFEIEKTLLNAIERHPQITVLENHMAVDLITTKKLAHSRPHPLKCSISEPSPDENQEKCVGLYVLNEESGEVITLQSGVTILATGGCGKVYLYTTNPDIATGDGVAMAWRAGAKIANMEFMQFHPTCLFHPKAKSFLISEAVRGEGAILLNAKKECFMEKYDKRLELAPRDIVARAIDAEMKKQGIPCVYLDISHQPAAFLKERFPKIYETCLDYGIDITQQPIPVVPAAHYQCGGIQTDLYGETSLSGLYAIGETACTGLHGANRLASNSLLEALVMAHRAALHAISQHQETKCNVSIPKWQAGDVQDLDELVVIYHNWDEIRRLMWDYMGIVRTDKRLQRAAARLQNLHHEIQEFYWNFKVTAELLELRNLADTAALMVESAIQRKESRGLHYTLDYPQHDDLMFSQDTILKKNKTTLENV